MAISTAIAPRDAQVVKHRSAASQGRRKTCPGRTRVPIQHDQASCRIARSNLAIVGCNRAAQSLPCQLGMSLRAFLIGAVSWVAAGCGPNLIPILPSGNGSLPASGALEVVARSPAALDPLPVAGSRVVYGELQTALTQAVMAGASRWVARHVGTPAATFNLGVELIHAEAEYSRGRLGIALVVRATLRLRSGNAFLGQTQAVCREASLVSPAEGAPVAYRCMERLGRNLGGWLEDVAP